eukprot:gene18464-98_t
MESKKRLEEQRGGAGGAHTSRMETRVIKGHQAITEAEQPPTNKGCIDAGRIGPESKKHHPQGAIQTQFQERSSTTGGSNDRRRTSGPDSNTPQIHHKSSEVRPRPFCKRQPKSIPIFDLTLFSASCQFGGPGTHRPPAPGSIFKPVGDQLADYEALDLLEHYYPEKSDDQAWTRLSGIIRDPDTFHRYCTPPTPTGEEKRSSFEEPLLKNSIMGMGILSPRKDRHERCTINHCFGVRKDDECSRFILHPKELNKTSPVPPMEMPTRKSIHKFIRDTNYADEDDARDHFYRFPLHNDIERHFATRKEGLGTLYLDRLCMGWRSSMGIAQAAMRDLKKLIADIQIPLEVEQLHDDTVEVYTDASTSGGGYLIVGSEVEAYAWPWSPWEKKQRIHRLEGIAMEKGVNAAISKRDQPVNVVAHVDNQVVVSVVCARLELPDVNSIIGIHCPLGIALAEARHEGYIVSVTHQ